MKDKGSYDKQMLDGRKIQKKGNPRETEGFGVHSEAAWCGVVGVVCMLKGWSDGTVGKEYQGTMCYACVALKVERTH